MEDLLGDRCGDGPDSEAGKKAWDRSLVDKKRPQSDKSSFHGDLLAPSSQMTLDTKVGREGVYMPENRFGESTTNKARWLELNCKHGNNSINQ